MNCMVPASVLSDTHKERVAAIVLAAGASRRMRGSDKLLKPVDGGSLLRRSVVAALNSKSCQTSVVLRPNHTARAKSISGLPVEMIFAAQAKSGMAMSLRSGIAGLHDDAAGVVVLLADMPGITAGDINSLIDEFEPGRIVVAGAAGKWGNPAVIPAELFPQLMQLQGDTGAKTVLARHAHRVKIVDRPGNRARFDIDTPEDWKRWLGNAGGGVKATL